MAPSFAVSTKAAAVDSAVQQLFVDRALAVAVVRRDAGGARLALASAGASHVFTDLCLALSEAPIGLELRCIDFAGLGRVTFHRHATDDALVVFALVMKPDRDSATGSNA